MSLKLQINLNQGLSLEELKSLGAKESQLELSAEAAEKVQASYVLFLKLQSDGDWIYGSSSGFGPLAHEATRKENQEEHQEHLLYHLATGQGKSYPSAIGRSILALRIWQLAQGYSAIHPETLSELLTVYNSGYSPKIPSLGSVGASGDLTPLAHLALAMSKRSNAQKEEFAQVKWRGRDALAFVNGTAASAVLAVYGLIDLKNLFELGLQNAFLHSEIMGAFREAWSPSLAQIHPQQGHLKVSKALWEASNSSDWFSAKNGTLRPEPFNNALPQDPYSIRCLPQLMGAVYDQIKALEMQVEIELHSISDNPSFFVESGSVVHGGNFNAQHLSFVADQIAIQVVYLCIYAEKRISTLCNPKSNFGLSPFLRRGEAALNSGFMGAQVSATSLLAELKSLQSPLSLQSMATNNNNQDMVSMATLGAWRAYQMSELAQNIISIELMLNLEALKQRTEGFPGRAWSSFTQSWQAHWSQHYQYLREDRPLSDDIQELSAKLEKLYQAQSLKLDL